MLKTDWADSKIMTRFWQGQFRAALSGLVLADRLQQLDLADSAAAAAESSWPRLLSAVAHQSDPEAAADRDSNGGSLRGAIQAAEAAQPLGLCLALLPLIWLHLEGPGGASAIASWAEQQQLQATTQTLLLQLFDLVQQGLRQAPDPFWRRLPAELEPPLADAVRLSAQAQGQYALAVRLGAEAVSDAVDSAVPLLPLVGLLTAIHGGLTSLPLGWRLQQLGPQAQPWLQARWGVTDETELWQIADRLFYRWVGVSPRLVSDQPSLYAVTQLSSYANPSESQTYNGW